MNASTSGRHPSLRPKQSLGQNFLRDENIARKIVAAVAPQPNDIVLEIGPGEGALTKYLVSSCRRLIVVDIDERVIRRMQATYPKGEVEILHRDFLETDLASLRSGAAKLRIVGNIPYNITTPILFHILDHRDHVQDATLMMQREVARRLIAQPKTKDYGILAVFCQLFTRVRLLFDVSPTCFFPVPGVTSSVVQLHMREQPSHTLADEEFFRAMVRSVFGKRRKTLRNSLKYFLEQVPELPSSFDLSQRPEELSIAQLVALANVLHAHTGIGRR
jgi:16S rRNA (adenine1518-N6/adenine1519-N6)-dimethyltransferase